jgi:hypothetical protein
MTSEMQGQAKTRNRVAPAREAERHPTWIRRIIGLLYAHLAGGHGMLPARHGFTIL